MSFWSIDVNGSKTDFDTLGIHVLNEFTGLGMPPMQHNYQSLTLQPGALYMGSKVLPRTLDLKLDIEGTTYANLHALRNALISAIRPTTPSQAQAVKVYYSGAAREVYGLFRYDSGLEFGPREGFRETPVIRLTAADPFWYETGSDEFNLDAQDTLTGVNGIIALNGGVWEKLGAGVDNIVRAIVPGTYNGYTGVFIGGDFVNANGSEVNYIVWFDQSNGFVPLAGGGTPGPVQAIAQAANGDIWAGYAGGVGHYHIGMTTWDFFDTSSAPATSPAVYAVAIASNGTVYIGGYFINFDGASGANYIASYNGSEWAAVGSGGCDGLYCASLAFSPGGVLYAGSLSSGTSLSVMRYVGGTWQAATSIAAASNARINCLAFNPNGNLYFGGIFETAGGVTVSNIAKLSAGGAVSVLGEGCSLEVLALYYSGGYVYVNDYSAPDYLLKRWNGSAWSSMSAAFSMEVTAIGKSGSTLYVGVSGTATFSGAAAVVPTSTAPAYPVITLANNSGSAATLNTLTNETSGHVINFDYVLQDGESLVIDLSPGQKTVISSANGPVPDAVLETSSLSTFVLLGGLENTVTFYSSDNNSVTVTIVAPVLHWSVDGAS
jgi:hypothetical protein